LLKQILFELQKISSRLEVLDTQQGISASSSVSSEQSVKSPTPEDITWQETARLSTTTPTPNSGQKSPGESGARAGRVYLAPSYRARARNFLRRRTTGGARTFRPVRGALWHASAFLFKGPSSSSQDLCATLLPMLETESSKSSSFNLKIKSANLDIPGIFRFTKYRRKEL